MADKGYLSLERAIWEVLGPIRAWTYKDRKTGEQIYLLDQVRTTEKAIKVEAHRRLCLKASNR